MNELFVRVWEFYHPEDARRPIVRPEPIPRFVDELDVRLALWIYESMLEEGS